MLAVILLIG
ncbi:MAG: hypothetical protein B7X33_03845, partial [Lysobacterales bacterium 13-68-4]